VGRAEAPDPPCRHRRDDAARAVRPDAGREELPERLQTLRQVEFALFDMRIHAAATAEGGVPAQAVLETVRSEVSVLNPPEFNRFAHGFSHIFAGGYAAGYYSYKWAEVLSADAYSLFEERGVLNPEIGARFRDEVLAMGGSRPALESFVKFRGREPKIDALLRHGGMD
jgi:oligopeptidase A